jgi:hypothetical protein
MKRCPSCQRTYPDDAPDYCSTDGMRLVNEEAAEYDPEKTVMASGLRTSDPEPPPQVAPPPSQFQAQGSTPEIKPPTGWQPQGEQPPQQWQQPGGQPVQPVWSPSPQTPNWGGASQQPAANAPYAPYAPVHGGRSRALSIAALVTGACAVTIMSLLVVRDPGFVFTLMLIMAILGIGLGVTALIISLQKPARFGGVPLAIAGLATGTAALVYYFTL